MSNENPTILVVGAGAAGGYFGGRLAGAGRQVTFLVRPARAAQLRADGLQIRSAEHGDLTIAPRLVSAGGIEQPFDLVLLAVKAYALDAALADLAPAVGPGTVILPLLNGMRHLDVLTSAFGAGAVLGGVCVVSTSLDPAGRIVQLAGMQELTFGEPVPGAVGAERLQTTDQALSGAGFATTRSERIVAAMWQKWILLATTGALNCLMRGTVGDVVAAPGGLRFAADLLAETAAVAQANGYPLGERALAYITGMLSTPGSTFSASMYRDLTGGRPVEAEAIVGDLVTRAETHGVPVPLLRLALTHLSVYQARLR